MKVLPVDVAPWRVPFKEQKLPSLMIITCLLWVYLLLWTQSAHAQSITITHTVKPGETLSEIAKQYGVSTYAIARANGIVNPNHIFSGQRLRITVDSQTPRMYLAPLSPQPHRSDVAYTVRSGDSLYSIAIRYDVTINAILERNHLSSTTIFAGQRLFIPRP